MTNEEYKEEKIGYKGPARMLIKQGIVFHFSKKGHVQ